VFWPNPGAVFPLPACAIFGTSCGFLAPVLVFCRAFASFSMWGSISTATHARWLAVNCCGQSFSHCEDWSRLMPRSGSLDKVRSVRKGDTPEPAESQVAGRRLSTAVNPFLATSASISWSEALCPMLFTLPPVACTCEFPISKMGMPV